MARSLISLALESAVGAELALFAVFLLAGRHRRSPALYLLAALAVCMTVLTTGNLLASQFRWPWLEDAILAFDLLTPPLIYLYVTQMRRAPALLASFDVLHAVPALLGIAIWKSGLLHSMDLYVNACWFIYLAFAIAYFTRHFRDYVPRPRQRFLALLLGLLITIWLLRLVVISQAAATSSFRDGIPYLMILTGIFVATCLILFTALSHPDLLSVPGSHVKYSQSVADDVELDRLHVKLTALLEERRPFLDPDFSPASLAALLDAPSRAVSQLINARHGMNFSSYMNQRRAAIAARLLRETDRPVKQVMFEAGFRSKSIFNREFQRHQGISPSEYRRRTGAIDPAGG